MAYDFGFKPTTDESGYYFISYNTEDGERIAEIARRLHALGLPMWYDKGIPHDESWKEIITKKIGACKEVILFVTRGIFEKGFTRDLEDIYTYKEYRIAKKKNKRLLIIALDSIGSNIPDNLFDWSIDLEEKQGMYAIDMSADEIAKAIFRELGFDLPTDYSAAAEKQTSTTQNSKENSEALFKKGLEYDKAERYDLAFRYFQEAANQGHVSAMAWVGCYFEQGRYVKKDVSEAIIRYEKAAARNNAWSCKRLGEIYYNQEKYDEALEWFYKGADLNHAGAMSWLGFYSQYGIGKVSENLSEAIKWYEKAAKQNDEFAIRQLGKIYFAQGDFLSAFSYLKKGHDLKCNDKEAERLFAECYEKGIGVSIDLNKAFELYSKTKEKNGDDSDKGMTRVADRILYQLVCVSESPDDLLSFLKTSEGKAYIAALDIAGENRISELLREKIKAEETIDLRAGRAEKAAAEYNIKLFKECLKLIED